jgi:hypothetical protein
MTSGCASQEAMTRGPLGLQLRVEIEDGEAAPSCDDAFDSPMTGCTASAGTSQTEYLKINAPTSSTDTSPTFTITTTQAAAP